MKKINNKGFTLVELLAVIVILITIMAIAVPTINSSIGRSKEKQNVQRIKVLESAAMEYVNDEINNGPFNCIDLNTLLDKGYITKDERQDADGNYFKGYIRHDGNVYKYVTSGECNNTLDGTNNNNGNNNGENDSGNTSNIDDSSSDSIVDISKKLQLGDYVSMTPTSTSYTIDTSKTGYTGTSQADLNPRELNLWRVIRKNADGSVDVISDKVSSVNVYFKGELGYRNFVGYLNTLARQYENSTYTSGSRYFGYYPGTSTDPGQTEFITDDSKFTYPAPWTCSTGASGCNAEEPKGGGDELYKTDFNLVHEVLGTTEAYKVETTTATPYWTASRHYVYSSATSYHWTGRSVNHLGWYSGEILYNFSSYSGRLISASRSNALRPIVTLKYNLKISGGNGSSSSPYTLKVS